MREFRKDFLTEISFLHSDEFESSFSSQQFEYPAILRLENNNLTEIITSEEINNIKDLQALIERIKILNLSTCNNLNTI